MGPLEWEVVRQRSQAVLSLQSDHGDAQTYWEASAKALGDEPAAAPISDRTPTKTVAVPTSFANGRYQIKEFLGEGGKKRVYRAHDSVLDRDVALAVIKPVLSIAEGTEGLDAISRVRITREAQATGRAEFTAFGARSEYIILSRAVRASS